jgi:uncharacterized protein YceK
MDIVVALILESGLLLSGCAGLRANDGPTNEAAIKLQGVWTPRDAGRWNESA